MRKPFVLGIIAAILPLASCFKAGPAILSAPVSISIAPTITTLAAGQGATISAAVYDQSGRGVTWSVAPLNIGTLSNPTFNTGTLTASVTYSAPANLASPTTVTITATSITNPNVTSSITLRCAPVFVAIQSTSGFPMAAATVSPADFVLMQSAVANDISNSGVTWSLSPTGVGSLLISGANNLFAFYIAPPTISGPTRVVVTATSVVDPAVSAEAEITVMPGGGPNVALLKVNGGPVPGQNHPNQAYTSVTICNPGSSFASVPICQTVDGVLVDTGSYGLRILQSQIPTLKLSGISDAFGNILENCASRPDGSVLWGPVERADVYIAGETGISVPIQVIASTPSTVPTGCSSSGVSGPYTAELLGANGILGIGPEPTDCTLTGINHCDGSNPSLPPPNIYYSCPSVGCSRTDSPVTVGALLQVSNPVPFFIPDNNGTVIQLPTPSDPQGSITGTLTFGIGTEPNNSLGGATVLTLDGNAHFTTTLSGQTLTQSSIDSGSNALFFPGTLPACTVNKGYYCPTSPVTLSATNAGKTAGQSTVTFTVEDADSLLFAFSQDSVFLTLAGSSQNRGSCPAGNPSCAFIWGLPFFYGRTVYTAIDGQTVPSAPATPWWAY